MPVDPHFPIMNQTKEVIIEKIRAYVLQSAYAAKEEINDGTKIFAEGYFDSMGFVMLISYLNEEIGIEVMDSELIEENFESINAITEFILKKIN
jgi:acyl carrier protein